MMAGRGYGNTDTVWVDHAAMLRKACAFFRGRGRSRLAILTSEGGPRTEKDIPKRALSGLELLPHSIQSAPLGVPEWAENVVRLLMTAPRRSRPDCLFIADDNFVESATRALRMMGIDCPGDIEVVGHTNFPWPAVSHVQIKRIGFRLDEVALLAEAPELVGESAPADAEFAGRLGTVVVVFAQGLQNDGSLDLFHAFARGRSGFLVRIDARVLNPFGQVFGQDKLAASDKRGAFHRVAQLTHVAGPPVKF